MCGANEKQEEAAGEEKNDDGEQPPLDLVL